MGEVYRAHDAALDREVALKILPDAGARDADRIARFRTEARALAALNHPNIAVIHGLVELGDGHAIVMELVEGPTLADRLTRGTLPTDEAVAITSQIVAALAAAHDRGIIHRDLKPANVKVRADGTVKLLDFGLAKLVASPGDETRPAAAPTTEYGLVMGSPPYMSPEQMRGEPIDARSDLFAVGALLYELVTGKHAFPSPLDRTPPSLADVPRALRPVLGKLLQPQRETRYPSAAALAVDLRGVEQQRSRATRRPGRRLVAAAVVLAALVGWTLMRTAGPTGPVASPSDYVQITDLAESAMSPSLSPDGRMVAFKVGEDFFLGDGQIYVKLLPNGESVQLTHDRQGKYGPVFTPDGSRVAYTQLETTQEGLAWDTLTVPVLGGEPTRLLPNASGLTFLGPGRVMFAEISEGLHMSIVAATERRSEPQTIYVPPHQLGMAHFAHGSPDGRWVIVVEMDHTHAFGLPCRLVPADGQSAGRQVGPRGTCTSAAWSPDGRWMYFGAEVGGRSHLWRQRFPDGIPEQITTGPTEEEGVTVAADGRSLITALGIRRSSIWMRVATGERAIVAEGFARLPRPSRDGSRVYFLLRPTADSDSSELRVLDLASGSAQTVIPGISMLDYDLSADESEVAFTTQGDAGPEIWIAPVDRRTPPRLVASNADQVSFGPGHDLIARVHQAQANVVMRISKDGARRQAIDAPPVHEKGQVSPDGRWVIVYSPGSGTTEPVATFAVPADGGSARRICMPYCDAGWSADGRHFTLGVDLDLASGVPSSTLVVPLAEPSSIPELPEGGVHAIFEYTALAKRPGTIALEHGGVSIGSDPGTYVFTKAEFHTNLFQIPLRR